MMNNHESFFRTRKSVPNLSAANRNRLMALLNAPSTVFASPQPACRIPPKKTSPYRGCGSPETGYRYPSRESRSPTPSAMAVSCMGRSRSIERQTSCPASCPALRVRPFRLSPRYPSSPPCPPAAYGGGTAGFDVFRGGLGRVGNDGREGGPLPPLRRPVEGAQGLEQAMPRRAGDCDRAGGCRRIHAKRRARSHLACFLAVMPSCPILR